MKLGNHNVVKLDSKIKHLNDSGDTAGAKDLQTAYDLSRVIEKGDKEEIKAFVDAHDVTKDVLDVATTKANFRKDLDEQAILAMEIVSTAVTLGDSAIAIASVKALVQKYGAKEAATMIARETAMDVKDAGNYVTGLLHTARSKNIRAYIDDVQKITGRNLNPKQKEFLKNDLRENEYKRLSTGDVEINRVDFNNKRPNLIKQWEKETGDKWPTETYVNSKGKTKTRKYDAHHVVENKYGGKNEWWNITPAKRGYEHQSGIHRKDGPAEILFGR